MIVCFVAASTENKTVLLSRFWNAASLQDQIKWQQIMWELSEGHWTDATVANEYMATKDGNVIVYFSSGELTFFLTGRGEDELGLIEALHVCVDALVDAAGKSQVTEASVFDNYERCLLVLDEVVDQGMLAYSDLDTIRKHTRLKS